MFANGIASLFLLNFDKSWNGKLRETLLLVLNHTLFLLKQSLGETFVSQVKKVGTFGLWFLLAQNGLEYIGVLLSLGNIGLRTESYSLSI